MLSYLLVHPVSLAAEHQHSRTRVIDLAIKQIAALVQAVYPEPSFLQILERLRNISDARHGDMFESAGGSFGHRLRKSGRAPFGNKNGVRSRGVSGPHDRTQIMRIFHAVEQDDQLCIGDAGFIIGISVGRAQRDHALMRGACGNTIQRFTRFEAYNDVAAAAELHDFLQARAAGAARDQHAIDSAAGGERFSYRMDAC